MDNCYAKYPFLSIELNRRLEEKITRPIEIGILLNEK
jgi:hypothetical protein